MHLHSLTYSPAKASGGKSKYVPASEKIKSSVPSSFYFGIGTHVRDSKVTELHFAIFSIIDTGFYQYIGSLPLQPCAASCLCE